eukprot:3184436-Prymnesium_polylepis.1
MTLAPRWPPRPPPTPEIRSRGQKPAFWGRDRFRAAFLTLRPCLRETQLEGLENETACPPASYRWAGGLLSPPYTTLAR